MRLGVPPAGRVLAVWAGAFGALWLMANVVPLIIGAVIAHRFPPMASLAYELSGALISASGFGALFYCIELRLATLSN